MIKPFVKYFLVTHFLLYCNYFIQDAHKKQKKTYPSQSSCNPFDAIIVSHAYKTPRPLPKFRAAKPTQQIATRRSNCTHLKEISSPQYQIYIDNTFRACGKDSPDKKPRARLIYITIRVNKILIFTLEITFRRTENLS